MTATVLSQVQPVTLDANGNGTAVLSPSVGEFWLPMLIRVATKPPISITTGNPILPPLRPHCTVYHGAQNVQDLTTYLDDTNTGDSDSTSMCAGTTVRFGESIVAVWSGGQPNSQAFLIVNGVNNDTPPGVSQLPSIPGTHFTGKGFGETVTALAQTIGSNILVSGASSFTSVVDVRPYASYYLTLNPVTSTAPATGYNPVQISLFWYSDSAGANLVAEDQYTPFADNLSGLPVALGTVTIEDVMRGPYMRVFVKNTAPADSVSVPYTLIGSTRAVPAPYARQQNSISGFLTTATSQNVGAGQTVQVPLGLSYGRILFKFFASVALNFTLSTTIEGTGLVIDSFSVGAGANVRQEYIMPKGSGLISVINGGGAPGNFAINALTLFDKV